MEEHDNIPRPDEDDREDNNEYYQRKRLKKSAYNKIISGVCGGLGEYLSIDPVFFRLIFLFGILLGGWGIIIYLVFTIILPKDTVTGEIDPEEIERLHKSNTVSLIAAVMLLVGLYIILDNFGYFQFLSLLGIPHGLIITLIIGFVLFMMFWFGNGGAEKKELPERFLRDGEHPLFGGVCSGFARYLGVTAGTVRIIFVFLSLFTLGVPVIIYFFFLAKVSRSEDAPL